MPEQGVEEKFSRIIDDLERIGDMNRRERPVREFSLADVSSAHRPETGGTVSLEYFRMVRLLAWQDIPGGAAPRLTYAAGEKVGMQFPVDTVGDLSERIREMGLGRAEVSLAVNLGREREKVVVKLHESAVSAGLPLLGQPVCHFESGLIAGALRRIFRRRVTVTETKCAAMGYEYCQFEAGLGRDGGGRRSEDDGGRDLFDYADENVELLSSLAAHAVTALENAVRYERTRRLVVTDPLTGAYNADYFRVRLREEVQRAERGGQPFALAALGVDGLKAAGERFGGPAGDELAAVLAGLLRKQLRSMDLLFRPAVDEFAILLPLAGEREAGPVLERVRREVRDRDFRDIARGEAEALHVTVSAGCAVYPRDTRYSDRLAELASGALEKARAGGGDRVAFAGASASAE